MAPMHPPDSRAPADSRASSTMTAETRHPTPTPEALAYQIQALSQAITSLTLEVEHLRHRVETLEHGASIRA